MTQTKSQKRKGEEGPIISPRRSPRFQQQQQTSSSSDFPRRSPRLRSRRSTPFPKQKIVFSPPPKLKNKVRFAASADTVSQRRLQRISRFYRAVGKAEKNALGLGLGLVLTTLTGWLIYKHFLEKM